MEEKIFKVNCDFCGKEIECPENMMDAKKHACFKCFQGLHKRKLKPGKLHVDIKREELEEEMGKEAV